MNLQNQLINTEQWVQSTYLAICTNLHFPLKGTTAADKEGVCKAGVFTWKLDHAAEGPFEQPNSKPRQ
jgi:hypothetical protein